MRFAARTGARALCVLVWRLSLLPGAVESWNRTLVPPPSPHSAAPASWLPWCSAVSQVQPSPFQPAGVCCAWPARGGAFFPAMARFVDKMHHMLKIAMVIAAIHTCPLDLAAPQDKSLHGHHDPCGCLGRCKLPYAHLGVWDGRRPSSTRHAAGEEGGISSSLMQAWRQRRFRAGGSAHRLPRTRDSNRSHTPPQTIYIMHACMHPYVFA